MGNSNSKKGFRNCGGISIFNGKNKNRANFVHDPNNCSDIPQIRGDFDLNQPNNAGPDVQKPVAVPTESNGKKNNKLFSKMLMPAKPSLTKKNLSGKGSSSDVNSRNSVVQNSNTTAQTVAVPEAVTTTETKVQETQKVTDETTTTSEQQPKKLNSKKVLRRSNHLPCLSLNNVNSDTTAVVNSKNRPSRFGGVPSQIPGFRPELMEALKKQSEKLKIIHRGQLCVAKNTAVNQLDGATVRVLYPRSFLINTADSELSKEVFYDEILVRDPNCIALDSGKAEFEEKPIDGYKGCGLGSSYNDEQQYGNVDTVNGSKFELWYQKNNNKSETDSSNNDIKESKTSNMIQKDLNTDYDLNCPADSEREEIQIVTSNLNVNSGVLAVETDVVTPVNIRKSNFTLSNDNNDSKLVLPVRCQVLKIKSYKVYVVDGELKGRCFFCRSKMLKKVKTEGDISSGELNVTTNNVIELEEKCPTEFSSTQSVNGVVTVEPSKESTNVSPDSEEKKVISLTNSDLNTSKFNFESPNFKNLFSNFMDDITVSKTARLFKPIPLLFSKSEDETVVETLVANEISEPSDYHSKEIQKSEEVLPLSLKPVTTNSLISGPPSSSILPKLPSGRNMTEGALLTGSESSGSLKANQNSSLNSNTNVVNSTVTSELNEVNDSIKLGSINNSLKQQIVSLSPNTKNLMQSTVAGVNLKSQMITLNIPTVYSGVQEVEIEEEDQDIVKMSNGPVSTLLVSQKADEVPVEKVESLIESNSDNSNKVQVFHSEEVLAESHSDLVDDEQCGLNEYDTAAYYYYMNASTQAGDLLSKDDKIMSAVEDKEKTVLTSENQCNLNETIIDTQESTVNNSNIIKPLTYSEIHAAAENEVINSEKPLTYSEIKAAAAAAEEVAANMDIPSSSNMLRSISNITSENQCHLSQTQSQIASATQTTTASQKSESNSNGEANLTNSIFNLLSEQIHSTLLSINVKDENGSIQNFTNKPNSTDEKNVVKSSSASSLISLQSLHIKEASQGENLTESSSATDSL